ncbi:protein lev-9-like [Lineus longissimus]|uniref:protein lev-9-like n=1 Tax=Lineus longissimus TaxID=88925 RepID=UPI00315DB97B
MDTSIFDRKFICLISCIILITNLCTGLKLDEGQILSPNYPNPYPSAKYWIHKLSAKTGNIIHLMVNDMDIPDGDTLRIKDGSSCDNLIFDFSNEIAKFEAKMDPSELPFMAFSMEESVCLYLSRIAGGGKFNITYNAFPKCTGDVPYLKGSIVSPNYPRRQYTRWENCRWSLSASKGQIVRFDVIDLGVETTRDCNGDYLQITGLDPKVYQSGKVRLCGQIENQPEKVFETVGSEVDVRFVSDWLGTDKGFWLQFEVLGCKHWELVIKEGTPPPRLLNPASYYNDGYIAKFMCPRGYVFKNGVKELPFVCQKNRTWTGYRDQCEKIVCGSPARPASGFVTLSNGDKFESVATYTCKNGSTMIGENTRICGENGSWIGTLPFCKGAETEECGDPGDPPHGFKLNEDSSVNETNLRSYPFGTVISYACHVGYILAVGGNRTCLLSGTWSGEETKCNIVRCPSDLATPANGTIEIPGNTEYGAIVTYSCDSGFELINGNKARQCQPNARWSGQAPLCKKLSCNLPEKPWHGNLQIYHDPTKGNFGIFTCDVGYALMGQNTTTCTVKGTWTNPTPICEAISCPDLRNRTFTNVAVSDLHGEKFGSTARFLCNKGFYFDANLTKSSQVVICLGNRTWSVDITGCPFAATSRDPAKQSGNDITKTGMYVGIAVAGVTFLIIIALISAYVVRKRKPEPVEHEKNFDNPMYTVDDHGIGQVRIGEDWNKNPTYKDSDRACTDGIYDRPPNSAGWSL